MPVDMDIENNVTFNRKNKGRNDYKETRGMAIFIVGFFMVLLVVWIVLLFVEQKLDYLQC